MSKKERVLVAMSGGVDSSVVAMLLQEQGYELIGITLKTWDYETAGVDAKETGCCSLDSINDAREVAVSLGFPHYVLDIREEFEEKIITNFIDEYLIGRTPNPCVICNTHIKWGALLKRADQLNCKYIATGHYAQVREENGRYIISKGADSNKDQSYVLWGLDQDLLKRTMLPLGKFTKSEIKELAKERGFLDIANKRESYEICFIPDNDYRNFLNNKVPDINTKVGEGNFIDSKGNILGKHKGFPFYTIGQRKGLNIAAGEPLYVIKIISETNTVILGKKDELGRKKMFVKDFNLIKYPNLDKELEVITKIRYKDEGTESIIKIEEDEYRDKIHVEFYQAVQGIAPGQSAVFYDDSNDLVGGGFIM